MQDTLFTELQLALGKIDMMLLVFGNFNINMRNEVNFPLLQTMCDMFHLEQLVRGASRWETC